MNKLNSDEPLDHSVDSPAISAGGVAFEKPQTGHLMDHFDQRGPLKPTEDEIRELGAGMPEFSIFWKGDRDPVQVRREYLAAQRRAWVGEAAAGTVTTLDDLEGKVARVFVCSACQRKDRVLGIDKRCFGGCES